MANHQNGHGLPDCCGLMMGGGDACWLKATSQVMR